MAKSGKMKIKRKNSQLEPKSVAASVVSGATKNGTQRTAHEDSACNSSIPKEIIYNILSLLPVSVLQETVRFVCKEWNAIITDPLFIRAHLLQSLSSAATTGFLIQDKNLQDAKLKRAFYVRPYDCAVTKLKLPFEATILGSCNGLLLLKNAIIRDQLFVVNLVTKAHISLPSLALAGVYARRRPFAALAFAPSSGQYKVLYVSCAFKDNQAPTVNPAEVKVMVCTVAVDDTWRAIDCQGITMGTEDAKVQMLSCPFSSAGGYICWFHKSHSYGFALDIEAETMYQFAGPKDHVMPSIRICIIPMDTGVGVLHKLYPDMKCWKVREMTEPKTGTWGTCMDFDAASLDSAIERHFGPQTVAAKIPLLISMKTGEIWLSCSVWSSHDYNIGLICYNWKTRTIWSPSIRWLRGLVLPHLHVNSLLSLENL